MNASVYASNDRRHLTLPPDLPPHGYFILGPAEELENGDQVWCGCEEMYVGASGCASAEAVHFIRAIRKMTMAEIVAATASTAGGDAAPLVFGPARRPHRAVAAPKKTLPPVRKKRGTRFGRTGLPVVARTW